MQEAQVRGLVTAEQLRRRAVAVRGAPALRAALALEPALTRSEAERRLLALIRAAELPRPQTNARIGPYEVDAVWSQARVVVEVDGYAFHGTRAAFERDRRRDADLAARRFAVLRFTWRELTPASRSGGRAHRRGARALTVRSGGARAGRAPRGARLRAA